jgi:hypothetical protein
MESRYLKSYRYTETSHIVSLISEVCLRLARQVDTQGPSKLTKYNSYTLALEGCDQERCIRMRSLLRVCSRIHCGSPASDGSTQILPVCANYSKVMKNAMFI